MKASISLRISNELWGSEEQFEKLLHILDRYPAATDELTLFSSHTHPPSRLLRSKPAPRY